MSPLRRVSLHNGDGSGVKSKEHMRVSAPTVAASLLPECRNLHLADDVGLAKDKLSVCDGPALGGLTTTKSGLEACDREVCL